MNQNTEIWNGDIEIANILNRAGQLSSDHSTSKIFDSNPQTCWVSEKDKRNELKIIGLQFNVSFRVYQKEAKKLS